MDDSRIPQLGPWSHNLHLPDGTETAPNHPLGDFPRLKWLALAAHLPQDLSGWRVLDVGCSAGFYSIALAQRGARVLAVDHDPRHLAQARWAVDAFGLGANVELKQMQVYDLGVLPGRFDLVLFMGVFHHLRHPLLALEVVAERVGRMLAFQTMTLPGEDVSPPVYDLRSSDRQLLDRTSWPKMAFIENRLEGDTASWWVPNHAAVLALLKDVGLRVSARPGPEIYLCEPIVS